MTRLSAAAPAMHRHLFRIVIFLRLKATGNRVNMVTEQGIKNAQALAQCAALAPPCHQMALLEQVLHELTDCDKPLAALAINRDIQELLVNLHFGP